MLPAPILRMDGVVGAGILSRGRDDQAGVDTVLAAILVAVSGVAAVSVRSSGHVVGAPAAVELIAAGVVVENVVAVIPEEPIVTRAAVEVVVSGSAEERIVAEFSPQVIPAAAADEYVVAVSTVRRDRNRGVVGETIVARSAREHDPVNVAGRERDGEPATDETMDLDSSMILGHRHNIVGTVALDDEIALLNAGGHAEELTSLQRVELGGAATG